SSTARSTRSCPGASARTPRACACAWASSTRRPTPPTMPAIAPSSAARRRRWRRRGRRATSARPSASASPRRPCRPARRATCRCASSSTRRCRATSIRSPCRTPSSRTMCSPTALRRRHRPPCRIRHPDPPLSGLFAMAQAPADTAAHHGSDPNVYFVPHHSKWPLFASVALFVAMAGLASWFNEVSWGQSLFFVGIAGLAFILFKWFADVILESVSGYYNKQVDVSFRLGMVWFIFSEVMFFAAFFGALFYARQFALPWLGGVGDGVATNYLLWEGYSSAWPTAGPGEVGGTFQTIPAWGLPLLNTLILLTSGVTITIAHHALKADKRGQLLLWLGATVLLGCTFLFFQVEEYIHAYRELNLTMGSGIYG